MFYAAALAEVFDDYELQLFTLLAFLGRYCHQPIDQLMKTPVPDLMMLADRTAWLIESEGGGIRERISGGGG